MKTHSSQRGATLVVALIFLVLMSLFALSAFNSSSSNLRIVGNTQARQESLATAQVAVEATISSADFATNPAKVAASPLQVDVDGNGTTDYTATLTPAPECTRVRPLTDIPDPVPGEPDPLAACRSSTTLIPGCLTTEWNIRAAVADLRSNAQLAVNQGVSVRVPALLLPESCK